MENKKAFGEYIRAKRTQAGLTQRSFADALFVTESAVSKWERGLSYPDITLIHDICRILGVSEHELLTASEDVEGRRQETLARRYMNLINRFRITQYFLYGIALITCFICNLAVSHTLSWFFIVFSALMTGASLTLLPLVLQKRRGLITLGAFTLSLLLLLFVCAVYTRGNWFIIAAVPTLFGLCVVFLPLILRGMWLPAPLAGHKAVLCFAVDSVLLFLLLFTVNIYTGGGWLLSTALPIAGVGLILPWGLMLIIRYAKIGGFFKTAACLGLSGTFFYFYDGFIDFVLGLTPYRFGFRFDLRNWSSDLAINDNVNALILLTFAVLVLIFAAAGAIARLRAKQPRGR